MIKWFSRPIRVLLVGSALMQIGVAFFAPIYAIFVKQIGGSLLDASLASGLFSLAAGLVTLFSARIIDKSKNGKLIIALGYGIMGLGYFLYIFVNSVTSLFLVQILIGLASAFYTPAYDLIFTKHMADTKIGKIWGSWDAMSRFSIGAGAILGGIIVSVFSFNAMFIFTALLCFMGGFYIYYGLDN